MPVSTERVERTIADLQMARSKFKPLSREYGYVTGAIRLLEDFDKLTNKLYSRLYELGELDESELLDLWE